METKIKTVRKKVVDKESVRELAKQAGLNLFYYPEEKEEVAGYQSIGLKEYEGHIQLPKRGFWIFGREPRLYVVRYYLCGRATTQQRSGFEYRWSEPLSKGVLASLIEAQETHQFCRFEVWRAEKYEEIGAFDPVLVGFTKWDDNWMPKGTFDQPLHYCKTTYKICEWV